MSEYYDLLSAIADLYGTSLSEAGDLVSVAVSDLNKLGVKADQISVMRSTLESKGIVEFTTPDNITYYTGPVSSSGNLGSMINADGSIRGYTIDYSVSAAQPAISTGQELAQSLDSNIQLTTPYQNSPYVKLPVNTELADPTLGSNSPTVFSKLKTASNKALSFVTGEVLPAVAATSLGIQAGKWLAPKLYDIAPDFWNALGMSADSFDPSTWNSITSGMEDTFLGRTFNTIFGLDPATNETTMYLDSNVIGYLLKELYENSRLFEPDQETVYGDSWAQSQTWYQSMCLPVAISGSGTLTTYRSDGTRDSIYTPSIANIPYVSDVKNVSSSTATLYYFNTEPFTVELYIPSSGSRYVTNSVSFTMNGKQICYRGVSYNPSANPSLNTYICNTFNPPYVGYILLYGDKATDPAIDGVTTQPTATQIDFSSLPSNPTVQDYTDLILQTYPDMLTDMVVQSTVLPDGTLQQTNYYPMPYPVTNTYTDAATGTTYIQPTSTLPETSTGTTPQPISQGDVTISPDTAPQTQTAPLIDSLQMPPVDNGNDTGTGSSPETVAITGSASSLWAVYNPTQGQVNDFGAWLWSPSFVDQLLKLFNDPMQSIIGIHKIFAQPAIGGTKTIVVGYLDSGVSSKWVSNQYTTIDCGSVNLAEQYQNVYDYSPYTQVSIYLPFIGIHQLDVGDIMRSTINVIYHVDVISGACLAEVKVTRDGNSAVLYQYSGNAAVTYPISSGSYMGMVSAVASIAGAAIATVASGGSALPLAMGAANAALNAHTRVSHSGSFSGNAGAMGCKIPYLIITRPQTAYADGIETLQGIGASSVLTVGDCQGFIQASDCDLTGIVATDDELSMIRAALLAGVHV